MIVFPWSIELTTDDSARATGNCDYTSLKNRTLLINNIINCISIFRRFSYIRNSRIITHVTDETFAYRNSHMKNAAHDTWHVATITSPENEDKLTAKNGRDSEHLLELVSNVQSLPSERSNWENNSSARNRSKSKYRKCGRCCGESGCTAPSSLDCPIPFSGPPPEHRAAGPRGCSSTAPSRACVPWDVLTMRRNASFPSRGGDSEMVMSPSRRYNRLRMIALFAGKNSGRRYRLPLNRSAEW